MKALLLWKDERYAEVWLIGNGPAINVSAQVFNHYRALDVPYLVNRHDGMLRSCMHQSGITTPTPV